MPPTIRTLTEIWTAYPSLNAHTVYVEQVQFRYLDARLPYQRRFLTMQFQEANNDRVLSYHKKSSPLGSGTMVHSLAYL
jgi:hypothetical protein